MYFYHFQISFAATHKALPLVAPTGWHFRPCWIADSAAARILLCADSEVGHFQPCSSGARIRRWGADSAVRRRFGSAGNSIHCWWRGVNSTTRAFQPHLIAVVVGKLLVWDGRALSRLWGAERGRSRHIWSWGGFGCRGISCHART